MLLFLIICIMHVSVCGYVHTSASACKSLKRASGSLKLELQAVVRQPLWVLGTEARSSSRAVHTPYWATTPDLNEFLCFFNKTESKERGWPLNVIPTFWFWPEFCILFTSMQTSKHLMVPPWLWGTKLFLSPWLSRNGRRKWLCSYLPEETTCSLPKLLPCRYFDSNDTKVTNTGVSYLKINAKVVSQQQQTVLGQYQKW